MGETSRIVKIYEMKENIKKTKVMKIGKFSGNIRIAIDGAILKQVDEFKCFESLLSAN